MMDGIKLAVEVAKRRRDELMKKKEEKTMTRAEMFELDMTLDCIQRGEKVLGISK